MPTIPSNSKCATLGCAHPRSKLNGYCLQHGGQDQRVFNQKYNNTQARKEFNGKYNTRQWQTLRQIQLSKNPICAGCNANGIITPASVVDHLFPWSHISEQAFFINRFQSLCTTHHAEKTQLEQHGIYRAYGNPCIDYIKGDYRRIMGVNDPNVSET